MLRVMKIDHVTLRILIESCINISGILEKTNGNANRRVRVGLKVRQVEASYFREVNTVEPQKSDKSYFRCLVYLLHGETQILH